MAMPGPSAVAMDPHAALTQLLRHLEDHLAPTPAPAEDTYYSWHPLSVAEFTAGMDAARGLLIERNKCWSGRETFLDLGSGIGTKLALARLMGWDARGVERHGPYGETSKHIFPDLPILIEDVWNMDAFDADLVYFFRLCVDLDREASLIHHVVSGMRPGTMLFHAGGPDPTWLPEVAPGIWKV